jgi:hypothetical protein
MRPNKALRHFKTRNEIVRVTGATKQAVAVWFKKDLIPIAQALKLAAASDGKLVVDPALYS